jgi:hypothetical protein
MIWQPASISPARSTAFAARGDLFAGVLDAPQVLDDALPKIEELMPGNLRQYHQPARPLSPRAAIGSREYSMPRRCWTKRC